MLDALWVVLGIAIAGPMAYLLAGRRSHRQLAQMQASAAASQQQAGDLSRQLESEKTQTQTLRDTISQLQGELAMARSQFESARQNIAEQRKLLEDAQHQLRQAFATASSEALARNNEVFLQLARE